MFNASRNKVSSLMLKLCKSVQESSEEVLFIKSRQLVSIEVSESCFSLKLNSCSTDRVSVEIYKVQFCRVVFHPIRDCMFGISFLTTLNIYKDYFKGRLGLHKLYKR